MSGRLYRTLRGQQWKSAAFWTATLYPGYIFCIGFFLNCFVWSQESSSAVPIPTIIALCALWFCVSLPLTFIGYYFGFRKQAYEHPVRTNQIPRQVGASVRPSVCVSVSPYLCMCASVSLCLFLCICTYPCVRFSVSVSTCFSVSVRTRVCFSVCVSTCVSVSLYLYVPLCLCPRRRLVCFSVFLSR